MDALHPVADAQVAPDEYHFDLDTGADVGMEDFDFKLDGANDDFTISEAQDNPTRADPVVTTTAAVDFEIEYEEEEEEEAAPESLEDDATNASKLEQHEGNDLTMEYQDEIGYEDEEPESNAAAPDSGAGEPHTTDAEHPSGAVQEVMEQKPVENDAEVPDNDPGEELEQDPTLEEREEEVLSKDDSEVAGEDLSAINGAANQSADVNADASESIHHSQSDDVETPQSGADDHHQTSADMSTVSHGSAMPEVTVHYNQGQYTLVGAPSDDPDSYFLSDAKELGGPLSQLLASLRAVISDEVAPEDEVVVRIDALDLEFGEKSNQRFLARTFNEIMTCFSALSSTSLNDSQEMELDLLTRRDCETRFMELLEEAGLAEGQSDQSEMVEEEEEEESSLHEDSADSRSEISAASGQMDAVDSDANPAAATEQLDNQLTTAETVAEHNDAGLDEMVGVHASLSEPDNMGLNQLQPSGETAVEEEYHEMNFEQEVQFEQAIATSAEEEESYAHVLADASTELETFMTDEMFDQELAIDLEGPLVGGNGDEWTVEDGGEAEGAAGDALLPDDAGVTGEVEAALNDVDATLTLDATFNTASDNSPDDVNNDFEGLEAATGIDDGGKAEESGVQEPKSQHTSRTSTVNGDTIGLEEQILPNSTAPVEGSEPVLETPGDEIDWENDAEDGEQNTTIPTPSGKRGRTNEPEGLPDGTDNKRRRT